MASPFDSLGPLDPRPGCRYSVIKRKYWVHSAPLESKGKEGFLWHNSGSN